MCKALFLSFFTTGLLALCSARGDTTTIAFDSGSHLLYSNMAMTTPLTGGVAATLGDGDVLQLGYYSSGTVANPFAGTFVSLAGAGSLNTFPTYGNKVTIGDDPANGAGNGSYALSLSFVAGSAATGNNLPATGQELVIRFFNGTTLANSTKYNAVSAPTWLFAAPTTSPSTVNLSLDDPGLKFQDGIANDFYTSMAYTPLPEPSTYVMIGAFVMGLVYMQARKYYIEIASNLA